MPNGIRYTQSPDTKGWMKIILVSNSDAVYLCANTKITIYERKNGKTYFSINDGNSIYVGQRAWISTPNEKHLTNIPPNSNGVIIRVNYDGQPQWDTSPFKGRLLQQWANLLTGNGISARVTLNSVWSTYTPIPAGTHYIMAPDRSHAQISTASYAQASGSICTDVWFPIKLEGQNVASSRYLHIGHLSEGCVTMYELNKWNTIYNYLISTRMQGYGGKIIGQLIVTV